MNADPALLNAALRCEARRRELEAAAQPAPAREPTPFELRQWGERLAAETREQRDRRWDLAQWYGGHDDTVLFAVEGEGPLTAGECSRRLKLGDLFSKYFRAQNSGEHQRRNPASWL